ncbi:unnamed protein product [Calypogeia fissa]
MCVLQPCANPTQVGVWWRDDTKWCLYSASHQALIRQGIKNNLQQIDLGTIVSNVHPNGARYVVNLQTMDQVAVSSGQRRPVMVIDKTAAQTPQLQAPPQATLLPSLPRRSPGNLSLNVHYRDSQGNLQRYDQVVAQAIIKSLAGNQRTFLVPDARKAAYLFFDLEAMEQYFVSHLVHGELILSNKPPVPVIVEVPWDATAMASLAAKADKILKRKILVMVIDKYRSDDHLDSVLPVKACPWTIVSKSSSTCSTALYEKFVDSVEEILQAGPDDIMGNMIKYAGGEEIGIGPVQIAFKPVAKSVKSPFDSSRSSINVPTRTTKAAFWMSIAAPAAAAHAVVYGCTVQILAYLVILPIRTWKNFAQEIGDRECSGYIEVDRLEHQIPLAEVTVR